MTFQECAQFMESKGFTVSAASFENEYAIHIFSTKAIREYYNAPYATLEYRKEGGWFIFMSPEHRIIENTRIQSCL